MPLPQTDCLIFHFMSCFRRSAAVSRLGMRVGNSFKAVGLMRSRLSIIDENGVEMVLAGSTRVDGSALSGTVPAPIMDSWKRPSRRKAPWAWSCSYISRTRLDVAAEDDRSCRMSGTGIMLSLPPSTTTESEGSSEVHRLRSVHWKLRHKAAAQCISLTTKPFMRFRIGNQREKRLLLVGVLSAGFAALVADSKRSVLRTR